MPWEPRLVRPLDQMREREAVLAATRGLLERARSGRGGCLLIAGVSGLGKTAALRAAVEHAPDGAGIGLAQGDAMEQLVPFGMLSQAVDQLGGMTVLGLSGAVVAPVDARANRFFAALRWLQSRSETLTLIGLDDLHWADPDSLGLLSFLARRIASLPVAIIGTLRPWPPAAHELAASLAHEGHAEVATLAPLSRKASGLLLADLIGHTLDDDVVAQAWEFRSGTRSCRSRWPPSSSRAIPSAMPASGNPGMPEMSCCSPGSRGFHRRGSA